VPGAVIIWDEYMEAKDCANMLLQGGAIAKKDERETHQIIHAPKREKQKKFWDYVNREKMKIEGAKRGYGHGDN
jgi:hypothetical protein